MKLETSIGVGVTIAVIAFLLGSLLAAPAQTIPETPPPVVVTTDGPWVVMHQEGYRESYSIPSMIGHFYRYENKPSVYIMKGASDFRVDCQDNEAAEKLIQDLAHAVTLAANFETSKGEN